MQKDPSDLFFQWQISVDDKMLWQVQRSVLLLVAFRE